jgi:hypothetical protein
MHDLWNLAGRAAALLLLHALCAPVMAWGLLTHAIINQEALRLLPSRGELGFLLQDQERWRFVTAGALPDMTFSFLAGGKTDPSLNRLFHDAGAAGDERSGFAGHLMAQALNTGRNEAVAFALGWWAHPVADRVGNAADAAPSRNVLDLPAEVWDLSGGLNDVLIDGVMKLRAEPGRSYRPRFETDLLVDSILSYRGDGGLADQDPAAVRARIRELERRFSASAALVHEVAHLISVNRRLVADLSGPVFGSPDGNGVADVDRSVADVGALLSAVDLRRTVSLAGAAGSSDSPLASLAAAGSPGPGALGPVADASMPVLLLGVAAAPVQPAAVVQPETPPRVERVAGALDVLRRALPLPPGVGRSLLAPIRFLADEALRVLVRVGLLAVRSRLARPLDARKRVLIAFCLKVAERDCTFEELKATLHRTARSSR